MKPPSLPSFEMDQINIDPERTADLDPHACSAAECEDSDADSAISGTF
jgi:hypothetical protein